MRVLVIGSGGREHAFAWKLAQSSKVTAVYVAPGNAGTHREPKVENVAIDPLDFAALEVFVKSQDIAFTVVGPEAPLVAGIVDYFRERDLPCLGPTQAAAQLEGSKAFAKSFMQRHGIPTAKAAMFTDLEPAKVYLDQCQYPIVIKADGLAAGKGVIIAQNPVEAHVALDDMLLHNKFGEAGNQIIIEDFLNGQELSFIVLCDGKNTVMLPTSQDHKARDDGDKGPNTGGMGAYSPSPLATSVLIDKVMTQVITPTLRGMAAEGNTFQGFLYAGLMVAPNDDIHVLEYNCRCGDPETQPIMMRLQSDFADMCWAALHGALDQHHAQWDERPALGVVMAAQGYPDRYETGAAIPTLAEIPTHPDYKIFHAGTKMQDSNIVVNGGRVLCVTALGHSYKEAQENAYRVVKKAAWSGSFHRNDIGYRAG